MTRTTPPDRRSAQEVYAPALPRLPLMNHVCGRSCLLTMPEVGHVLELIRGLETDHIVLIHQTDADGAAKILSPTTRTFATSGTVGTTHLANADMTARACYGLMRACAANDSEQVAGFQRHRNSTHLVIMAIPKRFFPADRPVRHDHVDDLLIDMARDGTISGWGVPHVWIRAAVDCRGGIVDIRENPTFDAHYYDSAMPAKDLVGFPNLLIRPR